MAQVIPQARLVYVVRDPIARMQSMYMHQVSAGRERRRPEAALLDDRVDPAGLTSTSGIAITARWTSPSRACTISTGYQDARAGSIRAGDPISAPG
jgi:hypothetical protein